MGKGSRRRPTSAEYETNYDNIFGERHQAKGGRWIWDDREQKLVSEDEYYEGPRETSFFIPNTDPKFNLGLGCMTNGIRHGEKIARARGLQPIGDSPVSKPEPLPPVRPVLMDGLARIRAQQRREA